MAKIKAKNSGHSQSHTHDHHVKGKKHSKRLLLLYLAVFVPMTIIFVFGTNKIRTHKLTSKVQLVMPYHIKQGEHVNFTIKNDSDDNILIENHCPAEPFAVFKWNDKTKEWEQKHGVNSIKVCKEDERNIPVGPHASASGNYDAWPELFNSPGLYRINAELEGYDQILSHDLLVEN